MKIFSSFLIIIFIMFLNYSNVSAMDISIKEKFKKFSVSLRNLNVTVRSMQDSDVSKMKEGFVKAYSNQYKNFTLQNLGKPDMDGGIPKWLQSVAEGEEKEFYEQKDSVERFDIVGVNEAEQLIAYAAVKIMNEEKVAYLAQGFVDPDFQLQGSETSFIQKILPEILHQRNKEIKSNKCIEIYTLLVRNPHNASAVAAHEKCGFKRVEKDTSNKYVKTLGYDPEYYITMALPVQEDMDVNSYIRKMLKSE